MENLRIIFYSVAIVLVLMSTCVKDYNPFENYSNAQVTVLPDASSKNIREGDTLSIFTTETLAVFTTVREKIDSFIVRANGNRYWSSNTIKPPFSVNYLFLLSYPDTGKKQIYISTFKSNNTIDSLQKPLALYVRSPLKQKDFTADYGAICTLSTPPMGDGTVMYAWTFDTAVIVQSPFNDNHTSVLGVQIEKKLTGYLWVFDTIDTFKSTSTPFSYEFTVPPPQIQCASKGLQGGDTVVSGSDTLMFLLQFVNPSISGKDSIVIVKPVLQNNRLTYNTISGIYSRQLTGILAYSVLNPEQVTVKAMNILPDTTLWTLDTFYLYYKPSGPQSELVRLQFLDPANSITTRLDSIFLIVDAFKLIQDSVIVKAQINGVKVVPLDTFSDTANSAKTCMWTVHLPAASLASSSFPDTIKVTASNLKNVKEADTSLIIFHNSNVQDISPPHIWSIFINDYLVPYTQIKNSSISPDTITKAKVKIKVLTVDNESGIDSVTITKLSTVGSITTSTKTLFTYFPGAYIWESNDSILIPLSTARNPSSQLILNVRNNGNSPVNNTVTEMLTIVRKP
jgi:hypothetical protein